MQAADHIIFLLVGILLPLVLFVTGRKKVKKGGYPVFNEPTKLGLYYANGMLLWAMAAVITTVWYFSGRSFASLGLGWGEMPYDPWAIGVLTGFLLLYGVDLYTELSSATRRQATRESFRKMGFLPVTGRQYVHFLFLAIAAGVGEEIIYRGFLITYLAEVLPTEGGWPLVVVLLPAVGFGVGHYYQGGRAVLKIISMAVLFGFFFYRTHSLWPLMLVHAGVDAVGGLLSWYLLGKVEEY